MRNALLLVVVAVLVLAATAAIVSRSSGYRLDIVMPSAEGTFAGDEVAIGGRPVGRVTKVGLEGPRALVSVEIDDDVAPLHEGTGARITWEAVISDRYVELLPGPAGNPDIPSGGRIESDIERVEVDKVLATLDPETMDRIGSTVRQLDSTLEGREGDLNATLATGGPAVQALGEVVRAVGSDGPAIRSLVTELRGITTTLNERDESLRGTIGDLGAVTSSVATREGELSQSVAELPSTLDAADSTFGKIPGAVDEAVPLLDTLQPATRRLPEVARNLSPVLQELRPAVADLRPTLVAAQSLLDRTPRLIDGANEALPAATDIVSRARPAVAFLRPYAPETAGWLANWGSIWAGQDSTGNFARALLTEGSTSVTSTPGILPPGIQRDERPAPGAPADQPWNDANGDGIR
ncbi:MCE family protein [Pseudonocardia sp. P1]